jgi:hypothetical protein
MIITRSWVGHTLQAIVVTLTLLAIGSVALRAQTSNSPFEAILTQLGAIIAILQPSPGEVTLSTPLVAVPETDVISCRIANVGNETIPLVTVNALDSEGTVTSSTSHELLPGRATGMTVFFGGGSRRCEFTFEGTAAAVRANVQVARSDGSLTHFSADAR